MHVPGAVPAASVASASEVAASSAASTGASSNTVLCSVTLRWRCETCRQVVHQPCHVLVGGRSSRARTWVPRRAQPQIPPRCGSGDGVANSWRASLGTVLRRASRSPSSAAWRSCSPGACASLARATPAPRLDRLPGSRPRRPRRTARDGAAMARQVLHNDDAGVPCGLDLGQMERVHSASSRPAHQRRLRLRTVPALRPRWPPATRARWPSTRYSRAQRVVVDVGDGGRGVIAAS